LPHCFRYGGFDIDERSGDVVCRYELDDLRFEERVRVDPDGDWSQPAAWEAARLVALLAGVSYYKAGAPPLIDLGAMPVRDGEVDFLRSFYVDGLGEFALANHVDLGDLVITGGTPAGDPAPASAERGPLVPFGGGLDSIVTTEIVRSTHDDVALFVVSREGDRFDAIERAATATGLPVVRASRRLDPQILRSAESGWLNGHVPVTGILSAIAVLAAVLDGRGAVVMSNEWSASSPTASVGGRPVNHQYSKSAAFEDGFRRVLKGAIGAELQYFSELRPFSELWIAERFATLRGYHPVFHSCNRAFHIDPDRRQAGWCGQCDKCCFIDLILSPFLPPGDLDAVFGGREPLADPELIDQFRMLLEVGGATKPFECVGDVEECRAALVLAARRPDRAGHPMLGELVAELGDGARAALDAVPRLLQPIGDHHIPDAYWSPDAVLPAALS
jgi:hypothetical protein